MRIVQDNSTAKRLVDAVFDCDLGAPFVGLVILDGETIHGAVIVNNYDGVSADVTFMGRADARSMRELARYLFNTLKVRRVTATTRQSNARAKDALERMGFQREGTLRERFNDEDGAIYGLLRKDFRLRF